VRDLQLGALEMRNGAFITSLNYGWLVDAEVAAANFLDARRHAARPFWRARQRDRIIVRSNTTHSGPTKPLRPDALGAGASASAGAGATDDFVDLEVLVLSRV